MPPSGYDHMPKGLLRPMIRSRNNVRCIRPREEVVLVLPMFDLPSLKSPLPTGIPSLLTSAWPVPDVFSRSANIPTSMASAHLFPVKVIGMGDITTLTPTCSLPSSPIPLIWHMLPSGR